MNKVSFVAILIIFISGQFSFSQPQSLTVSFAARSDTYGEQLKLDSILIKNISKGCDTILYSPDTVIQLYYIVGIDSRKVKGNDFVLSNCNPNPLVEGRAYFTLSLKKPSFVFFLLSNIKGEKLIKQSYRLKRGENKFSITVSEPGLYILTAYNGFESKSIKILNNASNTIEQKEIAFVSNSNNNGGKKDIGLLNEKTVWQFSPGDTLWYLGYALTPKRLSGSDIIENVPLNDTLITFRILEGIPCNNIIALKYEGKLYPTVRIKDRCWLKENLNVGTMIPGDSTMTNNGIIEKYCYDNKETNCDIYGGLYQWDELMNYTVEEKAQGICPDGWHVPSLDEWNDLTYGYSGDDFKERGNRHWQSGSNGKNTTGFTALPSGGWDVGNHIFRLLTKDAPFFTSTKFPQPYQWVYFKEFNMSSISISGNAHLGDGLAVRCIKDE